MKYLILLSAVIYTVSTNHLENGGYSYQYHTDHVSRSEIRHPNGHITGAYNYLDNNMLHKVKYSGEPNQDIHVVSHNIENPYNVFPKDVYHNSEITYRRTLSSDDENQDSNVQFSGLPPVYVRHVPSPVKNEPIVPIIDVASPLQVINRSYRFEESAPSHEIKSTPKIHYQYHVAPTPTHFVPEYVTPRQEQPTVQIVPEIYHQKDAEIVVSRPVHAVAHGPQPLLGADVPLTHDGLTYEVARARNQHFAAIAAVKTMVPALH